MTGWPEGGPSAPVFLPGRGRPDLAQKPCVMDRRIGRRIRFGQSCSLMESWRTKHSLRAGESAIQRRSSCSRQRELLAAQDADVQNPIRRLLFLAPKTGSAPVRHLPKFIPENSLALFPYSFCTAPFRTLKWSEMRLISLSSQRCGTPHRFSSNALTGRSAREA